MAQTTMMQTNLLFKYTPPKPKGETAIVTVPPYMRPTPVAPTTRKLGGKEGRPQETQFGEKLIQCPCMLATEDDRLYCNDWRENRQSKDCLYLVGDVWEKEEQLHCWLGLRK